MRDSYLCIGLLVSTAIFLSGCNDSATPESSPVADDAAVETTTVSFANTKCPIMGGKPTAELTAQYQGETIGFCCEGCPEKWAALSDEERSEKFAKVDADAAEEAVSDEPEAIEQAVTDEPENAEPENSNQPES